MNLRFLAVIVAALFASCNAASSATLSEQSNISTISSTNAAKTLSGAQVDSNRLVRGLRIKIDEDSDDENAEKEERAGANLNKVDDLADDIADDSPSLIKLFKDWSRKTGEEILSTPSLVRLSSKKFMERLQLYGMYKVMGEKMFLKKYLRVSGVGS